MLYFLFEIQNKCTTFLNSSPGDELLFNVTDGKADITQYIKLINTGGINLAYKVNELL